VQGPIHGPNRNTCQFGDPVDSASFFFFHIQGPTTPATATTSLRILRSAKSPEHRGRNSSVSLSADDVILHPPLYSTGIAAKEQNTNV
jgi:hypothetical protein